MTSYESIYGQNALSMASYVLGTSKIYVVDRVIHTREASICILKYNLGMVQNQMKQTS